jgi:hypothetical protein
LLSEELWQNLNFPFCGDSSMCKRHVAFSSGRVVSVFDNKRYLFILRIRVFLSTYPSFHDVCPAHFLTYLEYSSSQVYQMQMY